MVWIVPECISENLDSNIFFISTVPWQGERERKSTSLHKGEKTTKTPKDTHPLGLMGTRV